MLKLDKRFLVERFEATASQLTVPSPPLSPLTCATRDGLGGTR